MPLSSNRAECKDLSQTRAGKKNPSNLNSYCPQKDCYNSSRIVETHTWKQDSHQQNMHIPTREGYTSKRKVVLARETLSSKGGTSNRNQGLQTTTRERPVTE